MPEFNGAVWPVILILWVIGFYMSLAIYAKRWHDRDKSGWWTLIVLVPIIGSIWLLVEMRLPAGNGRPEPVRPRPPCRTAVVPASMAQGSGTVRALAVSADRR